MSTVNVRGSAMALLHAWPGFQCILEAMSVAPAAKLYLAGGVLRNIYADSEANSKDFDFFVQGSGTDRFLAYLTEHGRMTAGPFGSPRWSSGTAEGFYCDIIPIARFHNGLWQCRDIIDALNQFDFTANAIALDIESGQVFDPQNGIRDARERTIRAVRFDYPDEQISSAIDLTRNSILWTRLNHYAVSLNFKIDPVTLHWLQENKHYSRDVDKFSSTFFKPSIDANLY